MTYTESARAQLNALQTKDHVRILALETSCDETAAAIIENGRTIVSNIVFSQIDLHALYGGVVPEIASRAHVEACDRVIDEALRAANMRLQDVDALAVTYGPGLVGALLTGVSCMKGLSYAANKPLIPVNHIEGHVSANYISNPDLKPPFLCLVVSGGHSHIVRVNDYGDYTLLGQTMDDAAGEAFDKAARVLTLPYPGGPRIDAAASAAGYQTAIYNTYWNPRTESHLLDTLDFSRVAGIIFAMTPTQPAKVRELSRRVPVVAVGDRVVDFGIDTVDVDNFGAAQLVAKHLIGLGHKRIAYLSTALNEHHISRMRRAQGLQEAYRMWCPEGSVTICSHVNSLEAEITTPDLEYRSGMELAYKCLRNDKITGIVAINDMVAFGVLDALQREGYRVPEDFSLCGFDNVTTSGYQRIQLTTVDNNTFSHGKSAFNLLLERIEGGLNSREDQPINRVEYRSRLIVRGSTGKPRSGGL